MLHVFYFFLYYFLSLARVSLGPRLGPMRPMSTNEEYSGERARSQKVRSSKGCVWLETGLTVMQVPLRCAKRCKVNLRDWVSFTCCFPSPLGHGPHGRAGRAGAAYEGPRSLIFFFLNIRKYFLKTWNCIYINMGPRATCRTPWDFGSTWKNSFPDPLQTP